MKTILLVAFLAILVVAAPSPKPIFTNWNANFMYDDHQTGVTIEGRMYSDAIGQRLRYEWKQPTTGTTLLAVANFPLGKMWIMGTYSNSTSFYCYEHYDPLSAQHNPFTHSSWHFANAAYKGINTLGLHVTDMWDNVNVTIFGSPPSSYWSDAFTGFPVQLLTKQGPTRFSQVVDASKLDREALFTMPAQLLSVCSRFAVEKSDWNLLIDFVTYSPLKLMQ